MSAVPLVAQGRYPNLIVMQTLSKAWGLAGIRVGYALSTAARIASLRAAGAPYAVSTPSLLLASPGPAAGDICAEPGVRIARSFCRRFWRRGNGRRMRLSIYAAWK